MTEHSTGAQKEPTAPQRADRDYLDDLTPEERRRRIREWVADFKRNNADLLDALADQ